MELVIVEDDLSSPDVEKLLKLHAAEMRSNSPEGACHFLPIDELRDRSVTVSTARVGDQPAGCGAVQELDERHGEVKSMRTAPGHLGRGVGRAVLGHIVDVARRRGYERLSLETGTGESSAASRASLRVLRIQGVRAVRSICRQRLQSVLHPAPLTATSLLRTGLSID